MLNMKATISIKIEDDQGAIECLDGEVQWKANYGEYLRFMNSKKAMINSTTFTKEQKDELKKLLDAVAGLSFINFAKMRKDRKEVSSVGFTSLSKNDLRKAGREAAEALKKMK